MSSSDCGCPLVQLKRRSGQRARRVRTEICSPGMKTGDQDFAPRRLRWRRFADAADLAISPAGDVWVMNNWQEIDSCWSVPDETLPTRCGGQGVVIFFGMAKPVRSRKSGRPAH